MTAVARLFRNREKTHRSRSEIGKSFYRCGSPAFGAGIRRRRLEYRVIGSRTRRGTRPVILHQKGPNGYRMEPTHCQGVDVMVEAVATPATFDICQSIIGAGTQSPRRFWSRPLQASNLQPGKLVTHRFALDDVLKAYETFGNAARYGALKFGTEGSSNVVDQRRDQILGLVAVPKAPLAGASRGAAAAGASSQHTRCSCPHVRHS